MLNLISFVKFFIGGIINYLLKIVLTFFLTETMQLWYFLSYIITLAVLVAFGFFYNFHITYNQTKDKKRKFVKFVFFLLIFSAVDAILVRSLTETAGIYYLVSIIVVTTVLFPTKFYTYGSFVFKKESRIPSQMTGFLSPLLERLRIRMTIPWVKGSVLDVGCGDARILNRLDRRRVTNYLGVDSQDGFIKKTRIRHQHDNFLAMTVDGSRPFFLGKFDSIILMAVLEHLKAPLKVLGQLKNNLTAEGRIIITTPTPQSNTFLWTGSKLGLFSKEAFKEHEHYFNKKELFCVLEKSGFETVFYKKFELGLNQIVVARPRKENQ